ARLCRRLDGLPLALELAAARTIALSVEQIDRRLDDAMRLLTAGPRDDPAHHRTLRATLDWSHDLLPAAQRLLLRRLGVFPGSFDLDAAEQVCGGDGVRAGDVLDLLAGLVARSMVAVTADGPGGRRFRLLETVRQYAREQLVRAGEAERTEERHAGYVLRRMRDGDARLRAHAGDQQALVAAVEADQENLRAALAWAWAGPGRSGRLLDLAAASWWFWWLHGDFLEGVTWLRRARDGLDAADHGDVRIRAEVHHGLGWLARHQGEFAEAADQLTRARAGYAELRDAAGESLVLHRLAALAIDRGDGAGAAQLLARSLARAKESGDPFVLGAALYWEGVRRGLTGAPDASRLLRDAAAVFAEYGDRWAVGRAEGMLAGTLVRTGELVAAEAALVRARACSTATRDRWGSALWSLCEAEIHLARGAIPPAATATATALGAFTALGDRQRIADALTVGGRVADAAGDAAAADRLRRAAADPGGAAGSGTGAVLAGLGRGCGRRNPAGLTGREVDVLRLAAEGLTDEAIAERLVLSPRTVGGHLGAAYRKLAVRSRTAAVRRAAALGVLPAEPGSGPGTSAHPGARARS
ncbi:MAG TPA: LuxR C-terminal-related transcriptional regulator, partial [Pseudonocardia sp.]|nr:LuxR C-terminal-related transcriptional regulator [Pseudonocardia sp.]